VSVAQDGNLASNQCRKGIYAGIIHAKVKKISYTNNKKIECLVVLIFNGTVYL